MRNEEAKQRRSVCGGQAAKSKKTQNNSDHHHKISLSIFIISINTDPVVIDSLLMENGGQKPKIVALADKTKTQRTP